MWYWNGATPSLNLWTQDLILRLVSNLGENMQSFRGGEGMTEEDESELCTYIPCNSEDNYKWNVKGFDNPSGAAVFLDSLS